MIKITNKISELTIDVKLVLCHKIEKEIKFDLDKIISIIVTLKKTAIELPKARPPCPKPILKAKK